MAVNTNVFTGSDATLTLSTDKTAAKAPEGAAAQTIADAYWPKSSPVGVATNVKVCVETNLAEFYQIGQRHPVALQPSNISVYGQMDRAYINGALLKLLLGQGADEKRVAEPYVQPQFNLTLKLTDPARANNKSVLVVHGVRFENWNFELPEDTFVLESVTFKALFITVADSPAK